MSYNFNDDDRQYIREYRREGSNSWFAPLLLLPIAFLAGWAINSYMATSPLNQPSPAEVGVGGGPENNIVSPLPGNATLTPVITITPSPTTTPTPTPGDSIVQ